jgi:hypothetical protein
MMVEPAAPAVYMTPNSGSISRRKYRHKHHEGRELAIGLRVLLFRQTFGENRTALTAPPIPLSAPTAGALGVIEDFVPMPLGWPNIGAVPPGALPNAVAVENPFLGPKLVLIASDQHSFAYCFATTL